MAVPLPPGKARVRFPVCLFCRRRSRGAFFCLPRFEGALTEAPARKPKACGAEKAGAGVLTAKRGFAH